MQDSVGEKKNGQFVCKRKGNGRLGGVKYTLEIDTVESSVSNRLAM